MQNIKDTSKEKKVALFKEQCKEKGIKLTPQRLIIYEALVSTDEHPSTDMLYKVVRKTFPTISLDTVHRTLLTFCEIGVADTIEGTGNPKRFDGNLEKHHHFQCVKCKKIVDIHSELYDNIEIPAEIQNKFKVIKKAVRLEGICDECS